MIFASPLADHIDEPSTVRAAVARYLVLRVAEGMKETSDTYSHITKHLDRFCATLGDTGIKSVRADHIRAWAAALINERNGRPFDTLTVRHHLVTVKTFFRRAWREGWIDRDPTLPLVLPPVEEKDVSIIAIRDAFHFFKVNRDHRAIGRLALEAFGGIRYTTAGKIVKADIKFDRRGIEMPSGKHKSTRRKYRQGQPENMWTWVFHAPDECWDLKLRQYREEKKEMLVLAGLRPLVLKTDEQRAKARALKNVWRHSFASYLLAKAKDYAPIAYLMQHARATTTEVYEGVADETEAVLYFSITPRTVLMTWDEFFATVTAALAPKPVQHLIP